MGKSLLSWTGLAVLVVLLLAVNTLSFVLLRGVRADLTEDRLYTLSEGTRNILGDIDEPIAMKLYYSKGLTRGIPALETYGQVVQELLAQYSNTAGQGITLEIIDRSRGRRGCRRTPGIPDQRRRG